MNRFKPLLAAAGLPMLLAAAEARIDLNGLKEEISFTGASGDGVSLHKADWVKPEEQNRRVFLQKKVTGEYQPVVFTFTPDKDGLIWISFGGNWAKEAADRPFLLVDDVTVNGEPLPNGGFEESFDGNWSRGKDVTVSADANSGKAAVRVNHDNQIARSLKVEAGKPYEVKFYAKEAK